MSAVKYLEQRGGKRAFKGSKKYSLEEFRVLFVERVRRGEEVTGSGY